MRGLGVVVSLTLCLLATSCDEAKPSQQEPGSPEGIKVLADMERPVEEVNVCEAIRDAGAEGDLVDILGADSVELESDYAETEDAYTQRCEVIGEGAGRGDAKMSVSFFQGTEFIRADSDEVTSSRVVYGSR